MLDYTDLTIIKNAEGIPTALGYPINSLLLKNNKPLFVGGKRDKKKEKSNKNNDDKHKDDKEFDNLAVPAGLVCMTETICKRPDEMDMDMDMDMNTDLNMHIPRYASDMDNSELISDSLYDKLLALAEEKKIKKFTRRNDNKKSKVKKNKTQKHK